jgi:hypothetical protein
MHEPVSLEETQGRMRELFDKSNTAPAPPPQPSGPKPAPRQATPASPTFGR